MSHQELDLTQKTVEDYLNEVTYAVDPEYIPSSFALEFISFIKLVNGVEGESHPSPVMHYRMLDLIQSGDEQIANLASRGSAKTAVFGEYLILWCGVYNSLPNFGQVTFGIYVSDSIDNGVKNMRGNLEFRWQNSPFLQQMIPTTKFVETRWEFVNADGAVTVFKGYGAKSGVRGSKVRGKRPVIAILDDLVSDADAKSPTVIASIEDTVDKAVNHALDPTQRKIIWSGTPFNQKDPLYKAIESGAWRANVYPICEKFPCTRKEFKGAWEDRFSYDFIKKQYDNAVKSGKIDGFNQELMLRIMSDEDRLILDCDISWYKRASILNNRGAFNFYITTDFATSEKTSADFSVISVWAYNNNGDWFWVDGVVERQTMDKNINDLFRLAQQYNPQQVGVEISGQQKGFISWIQNEMLSRNIYFNLASNAGSNVLGLAPNSNKMERFNIVVPWFKMNKVFFPLERKTSPEIVEGINELRMVAKGKFQSKHDDFLDTISMLAQLTPWKPSQVTGTPIDGDNYLWDDTVHDDYEQIDSYIV